MASGSVLQDPSCQALHAQTITLTDGRTLGYAEFGSSRDDATPLFYLHGTPGCRLDAAYYHPAGCELNVRIVAFDRPGYGLSSPLPGRKILDAPADIRELAKHLSLEQYYVLGFSGGGPYALACAHVLPETELLGAGVVAGVGPWRLGTYGMRLDNRVLFNAIYYTPWLARQLVSLGFAAFIKGDDVEKMNQTIAKSFSAADWEFCSRPDHADVLPAAMAAAFCQGVDGMMEDGRLVTSEWGFEPEDIKAKHIRIWHGTADVNVPVTMGRYVHEQIPQSVLREFEGKTHFGLQANVADFLKDLTKPA